MKFRGSEKKIGMPTEAPKLKALYSKPSVFSTYQDGSPSDAEPGPDYYHPNTQSFGPQTLSKNSTAPKHKITGNREGWQKVFVTRSHSMAVTGLHSPGVGLYDPKGTAIRTDVGRTFLKSLRPDLRTQLGVEQASPGPAYDIRDRYRQCGVAPNSAVKFGKSERFIQPKTTETKLNTNEAASFGVVKSSLELHKHRYPFGLSHRAYDKVRRPGCEEEHRGKTSPGVGDPLWEDWLKAKHIPKFGTAKRFQASLERLPGPGAYRPEHYRTCLHMKNTTPFTKQTEFAQDKAGAGEKVELREAFNSDIRNPPAVRFGKPPKKGRLDLKRLMQCGDRVWGVN